MMNNEHNVGSDGIFSQPIRTLKASEIDQVAGGGPFEADDYDGSERKPAGSADNQGRKTQ